LPESYSQGTPQNSADGKIWSKMMTNIFVNTAFLSTNSQLDVVYVHEQKPSPLRRNPAWANGWM